AEIAERADRLTRADTKRRREKQSDHHFGDPRFHRARQAGQEDADGQAENEDGAALPGRVAQCRPQHSHENFHAGPGRICSGSHVARSGKAMRINTISTMMRYIAPQAASIGFSSDPLSLAAMGGFSCRPSIAPPASPPGISALKAEPAKGASANCLWRSASLLLRVIDGAATNHDHREGRKRG